MIQQGRKYLITTDDWFIAPDGELYKAAWGTVYLEKIEETLGFTPARPSTNWFAKVGSKEDHIIIAGCQIKYVIRCEEHPYIKEGEFKDGNNVNQVINKIYIAE